MCLNVVVGTANSRSILPPRIPQNCKRWSATAVPQVCDTFAIVFQRPQPQNVHYSSVNLTAIFIFFFSFSLNIPSLTLSTVLLNRGSTEPLVFDGAVSGVRWKSFKILTFSGAYPGGRWLLDLGEKLDVRRRDDLF